MRSVQSLLKRKWNLATIIVGVLLVGFIAFLVVKNYLSQLELQGYALEQLNQDIEKRAMAVSYFYSERRNDLKNLAKSREISLFFENKGLGMSMEYGLRASLLAISETFNRLLEERKLREDRIYSRITFIESNGKLLVDTQPGEVKHRQDLKKFLKPESSDVTLIKEHLDNSLELMVTVPYFFKEKYMGQIIAWISPKTVYKHLIRTEAEPSQRFIFIDCGKGNLYFPEGIQLKAALSNLPDLSTIEIGKPYRFKVTSKDEVKEGRLALKVPIKETPYFLVAVLPTSEVIGPTSPWHLPIGMAILSLAILGGMAIVLWMNGRNLALNTSLEESSKRKHEIEEKNLQLQKEISKRVRAEEALCGARDELEIRVRERTADLIKANELLQAEITERKQAEQEKEALEEQFRQSQKMEAIGSLAGGVAHDFNNLLTIIKGNSQLSLTEMKADDPLRENIEEIDKASDRAATLTRQLLAFGRRQILEMRVLDLNTTLRDLEKMLRRIIGEDVELVTFMAEDLGNVKADPGQVEQVIMNLAVNARDAMPKGGKLTIETANVGLDKEYARKHISVKPGSYVMLSISDTGIGMAPEVKGRIFEPFFTTKEKGKGTGLGLSTVYGIIKQSGGDIWVYSEPSQGTTFKIYFPRVDEPLDEVGKKGVEGELPRGNETILLVEDGEEVRKLAAQVLRKQGYKVLEASHGNDALLVCKQHEGPIQLMVTDVVMPGMSGCELAENLLSLYPEMKALYMSGYTDNTIAHHGILEPGLHYIQKPFSVEGLAIKVREVLDR